ncbi:hypothetical protein NBT05_16585 [Aquimarina sp. ERC-38]|uniref:hypothetical protein n=1 Tax=Aquimarina sp. ERC-38 TaxID=2949996 RepID=UPI002247377A|nr:hypothetical protein [Aquimarina sp. ERC-38]UZO80549.1 hypothetical protein NBT05_16585 [Aquimarina sp. ERC-38]
MELKNIVLKILVSIFLFTSCETPEEDIETIGREDITNQEFLQIEEKQQFINALTDSSITNYWALTKLQKGADDFAERFEGVRFVFSNPTIPTGEVLEDEIEGAVFEPGNLSLDNSDNTIAPTSLFKSELNNDALLPFVLLVGSEEVADDIIDKEKYDILQSLNPIDNEGIGFKILKDFTSSKVVLTRIIDGEERTLIFEKRMAPAITEFLQIEEIQQFINTLTDSTISDFWTLTKLQKGADDFADRFEGVRFVFSNPTIPTGEVLEDEIEGAVFEPGNLSLDNSDNTIAPTSLFKSELNNDALLPFVLLVGSEEVADNIIDKEKYDILQSLNPIDNEGIGFKILKDFTSSKVVLTRIIDGEERTLIFEKG